MKTAKRRRRTSRKYDRTHWGLCQEITCSKKLQIKSYSKRYNSGEYVVFLECSKCLRPYKVRYSRDIDGLLTPKECLKAMLTNGTEPYKKRGERIHEKQTTILINKVIQQLFSENNTSLTAEYIGYILKQKIPPEVGAREYEKEIQLGRSKYEPDPEKKILKGFIKIARKRITYHCRKQK